MTDEECVNICEIAIKCFESQYSGILPVNNDCLEDFINQISEKEEERQAISIIRDALEKQIPKNPKEKYEYMGNIGYGLNPNEYIKGYVCPLCGEWLEEGEHHCVCGQKIDWSEEE